MDKTIKFLMDNNEIKIEVISSKGKKEYKINKENRNLNAMEIYELLDYSVGDSYSYEDIADYGKDSLVLNKLKDLFMSITDKVCDSILLENDASLKEKIKALDKEE